MWGPPRWFDFPRSPRKTDLRQGTCQITTVEDYFGGSVFRNIPLLSDAGLHGSAASPRLLKTTGACPPEDVGGTCGYEEFLEALADPEHE
ncbi:plasmid pRiA4b ORF-3 family protein, partial [Aliiruegeria sabulilitoris]|uniref:plasmid pRiA4b ORF-3 family protein n=1 Tax=Aliiruegeria sabulilitoris TaxID=1510458 RepID=UPI0013BB2A12